MNQHKIPAIVVFGDEVDDAQRQKWEAFCRGETVTYTLDYDVIPTSKPVKAQVRWGTHDYSYLRSDWHVLYVMTSDTFEKRMDALTMNRKIQADILASEFPPYFEGVRRSYEDYEKALSWMHDRLFSFLVREGYIT